MQHLNITLMQIKLVITVTMNILEIQHGCSELYRCIPIIYLVHTPVANPGGGGPGAWAPPP